MEVGHLWMGIRLHRSALQVRAYSTIQMEWYIATVEVHNASGTTA